MKCIKRCYINLRREEAMGEGGEREGEWKRKKERNPFQCSFVLCFFSYGTLAWFLLFCLPGSLSPYPHFFPLGFLFISHSSDSSSVTTSPLFCTYSYLSVSPPLKHLLSGSLLHSAPFLLSPPSFLAITLIFKFHFSLSLCFMPFTNMIFRIHQHK